LVEPSFSRRSGHGIESAGIERMATRNAPDSHPASFQQSVLLYRLQSVLRATGCEPAYCGLPARTSLIRPDEANAHLSSQLSQIVSCLNASRITSRAWLPGIFDPAGLISMTKSISPGILSSQRRNASRHRLRTRLRLAMLPIDFAATTAARPWPRAQIIRSSGRSKTRPILKTRSNSALLLRRRALDSNLVAALLPPALEHVPTVLRFHSCSESVGFVLVAVIGLIGALHGVDLG